MTLVQNKILSSLIYIILILLPTYLIRFEIFSIPFTVLEVLILLLFVLFILVTRFKFEFGSYKYFIYFFIIIGVVATIFSQENMAALGLLKAYIIEPVLFFIVFINVKPKFSKVLWSLGLSAMFVALVGVVQYFTGYGIPAPWNQVGNDFRITSVYEYPNAVGLYLTPIIALFFGNIIKRKRNIYFSLLVILIALAAIGGAVTQGAWLAVIFSFIFLGFFTKWKKFFMGGLICGIILLFVVPGALDVVTLQNNSGEVRLAVWEGTMNMLKDRPLIGSGLASFPQVYAEYKLDRHVELLQYPHNIFLNFWTQLGLAGLLWLIFILFNFFYSGFKNKNTKTIIAMTAMVAILVYGLVDVPYFKNDLAILFWTILGLMEIFRE